MSVETGPPVSELFVSTNGLHGRSRKAIELARDEVARDAIGQDPRNFGLEIIYHGIDDLLDASPGRDVARKNRKRGSFFMSVSIPQGNGIDTPIDGLLYVEAEAKQPDGSFSVVNVSKWTSRVRYQGWSYEGQNLRELLTDASFTTNLNNPGIRVPISRDTEFININPVEGEPSGYFYGHDQDRRAVSGLTLPDEALTGLLVGVVDAYHVAEQSGDLDQTTSALQAAIFQA